jgi:hypothetical protein
MRKAEAEAVLTRTLGSRLSKVIPDKKAGSQRRAGDRKPLDQSTDRRPDRHRRGRIVADDDRPAQRVLAAA